MSKTFVSSAERWCVFIFAASVRAFFVLVNHRVSIVPAETCLLSD